VTGLAFRSQTSCLLTTDRLRPLPAASLLPLPRICSAGALVQVPIWHLMHKSSC